ncbi:MAG: hypothetical protein RLZZ494_1449 [Pseudomonadota bacterium]|jgi:4-hydroxymandelate oxidase
MSASPAPAWVNLHELAEHARTRLTPAAWAYFSGAAADGHTLAANRADWDALRLWPRVLRPLADSDTAIELAGQRWAHPIGLAPVAFQRWAHPDGEMGSALAAAAQGAGLVLSSQSSVAVEHVARAMREPGAGPLWFQLYWQRERAHTLALVQRAEAAGCQALVLTVDAPVQGVRDAERRAGFQRPPGVSAVHLADFPSPQADLPTLLAQAPTWDEVTWLAAHTRLPLWLKGVLHPDDARQAAATGAVAGLIVSNHGGRVLDTTVSTAWALPRVVDATALPVLVDGGIRRGTDVVKALALGARAVLVGRPQVEALAVNGALGVAQMLRLLRDEFAAALALCGCRHPAEVSRALLA